MTTRRNILLGISAFTGCTLLEMPRVAAATFAATLGEAIAKAERESGGRLGVTILDTQMQASFEHRGGERFPLCSTFKALAAAAILKRVDAGRERLDRRIRFAESDLVDYSPVTKHRTGGDGMTLAELCAAAITQSDNTAGNLLLGALDGPAGLTAFARSIGDTVTRLDRIEPDLNEAAPGDPRDTTTPSAMVKNLQTLLLSDTLSAASKMQLTAWLVANTTGGTRLLAGLPAGWRAGDKTGTGEHGTTNDVGILWPPHRKPIIVAAYLTETNAVAETRNDTIAAVARALASAIRTRT